MQDNMIILPDEEQIYGKCLDTMDKKPKDKDH